MTITDLETQCPALFKRRAVSGRVTFDIIEIRQVIEPDTDSRRSRSRTRFAARRALTLSMCSTAMSNRFTNLAKRYRNNSYVWVDVMNEPGGRTGIDANN